MTTKVLYSASLPVQGARAEELAAAGLSRNRYGDDGLVPYFVSGPLHRKFGIVGIIGSLLHICAWIAAVVLDILLLQKIKPADDTDKVAYDIFLGAFLPFVIAFGLVVITTVLHATKVAIVPEGGYPPFAMTFVTGGAMVTVIYQFMLVQMIPSTLSKYVAETDAGKQADYIDEWRRLAMWGLILKVFVFQFVRNNCQWAGPAEEYGGRNA